MKSEELKREIGVRGLAAAVINIMVGAGIFVLPAIVTEDLGTASFIAYLVCGILITLIVLCFAEIGSKVTTSGGIYAYIEKGFGPFAGFLSNNLFWLGSCVTSDAAVANALADSLKTFFPILDNEIARALFFFIIFGGLAVLNIRGVKQGIRFVEFITLAKLIPLLFLVFAGFTSVSVSNLTFTAMPSISAIGSTSLLLFFAFMGVEGAVTNSGEIKNPQRTFPRGILLGVFSVLILYVMIQFISQGILGSELANHKDAPLAFAAKIVFGPAGFTMMIVAACIAMFGNVSGEVLAIPRMLYAGAKDGLMPKFLATVHPKYATPYLAIIVYASLGFLFAEFGAFKQLAILSSAATLIIYLGVILATIKLRFQETETSEKTFKVPGGYIIPGLAIATTLWLLSNLSKEEIFSVIAFLGFLTLVYFAVKNLKKAGNQ